MRPGRWLAMGIGCVECHMPSDVIGTYDSEPEAEAAALAALDKFDQTQTFDLLKEPPQPEQE